MTKRAQVSRHRTVGPLAVGEFEHRRFELDHNQFFREKSPCGSTGFSKIRAAGAAGTTTTAAVARCRFA